MDRYRNDVPLSSYSIWSPKADPTRTMFNFERKLESQNKENNYRYDTFFAAKHISSPKADIQPMTQKSSSVEHRSFKFETAAEHSRKKSRELQLSAVMVRKLYEFSNFKCSVRTQRRICPLHRKVPTSLLKNPNIIQKKIMTTANIMVDSQATPRNLCWIPS